MVLDEADNDEELALSNLRHLNWRFKSKIGELKAQRDSLLDALEHEVPITEPDCRVLHNQLKELSVLKQKYSDLVEAFDIRFEAPSKAEEVDNQFKDVQLTYYSLKVDVESLLKRLRKKLATNHVATIQPAPDLIVGQQEKDKIAETLVVAKADEIPPPRLSVIEVDDGHHQQDKETSLMKNICIGLFIFLAFYACLAFIINLVLKDWARSDVTGIRAVLHRCN